MKMVRVGMSGCIVDVAELPRPETHAEAQHPMSFEARNIALVSCGMWFISRSGNHASRIHA